LASGGQKPVALSPSALPASPAAPISIGERCFDLTVTIVLLPVICLLAAAIAVAIYIDSPGPVIYRSRRVGRDGELFEMLKFRKMRREAGTDPITLDDDERFTPIGHVLARTRLDELPQVWNVLRGEMRLVGPRPELECFVDEFADEYREILTVTPGITGNAQLRFIDERSLLGGPDPMQAYRERVMPEKITIDLDYVHTHSLAGDLLILARTAALPPVLLVDRCWHSSAVRRWTAPAAAAIALAVVFAIVSSHLP
jgi:lipopolysaccharide/colanic/teichoic acid biosynthesis glycosyltransferase